MIKFSSDDIGNFSVLPRDAGQMVEVSYAVASEEGYLIQRTEDRSSLRGHEISHSCARIWSDGDTRFDPQNGVIPDVFGEWETCTVV